MAPSNNLKMAKVGTEFVDFWPLDGSGPYDNVNIAWPTGRSAEVREITPDRRSPRLLQAIAAGFVIETADAPSTEPPFTEQHAHTVRLSAQATLSGEIPVYNSATGFWDPAPAVGAGVVAAQAAPDAPAALTVDAVVGTIPAGGTGTAAGGWDTSGHRDAAIATMQDALVEIAALTADVTALRTTVADLRTALIAAGVLTALA
jgi:hypothetical protein